MHELIPECCDTFYHFAWEASRKVKSSRYFDVEVAYRNIGYALQAYDAACKLHCKNFVGAGSQAEYGNLRKALQRPEDLTSPVTCYAIAKDSIRRLLMIKSKETGVYVQWVRIFSVYGINDRKDTLLSMLISKMKMNEDIPLTECTQIWDYLFETDAGEALYCIGRDAVQSNVFCLGSGEGKPLREYVEELKEIINSISKLQYGAIPFGEDSVMSMKSDISKIQEKTRWKGPKISFNDGISKILYNNTEN